MTTFSILFCSIFTAFMLVVIVDGNAYADATVASATMVYEY